MNKKYHKKGYTLVELLVVIAIIAILTAVTVPVVAGIVNTASLKKDSATAQSYDAAISLWMSQEFIEETAYSNSLSATELVTTNMTEAQYSQNYMGMKQLPGIEFVDEDQIRHAAIVAIKTMTETKLENGLLPHPNTSGYGFKYYYRAGKVSVEKLTNNFSAFQNYAYDYYIWLDYDSSTYHGLPISISPDKVEKPQLPSSSVNLGTQNVFGIEFSLGNNIDYSKCTFTIENDRNSYTLVDSHTTPQMFFPGEYRIKYYYEGTLRYDVTANITESYITGRSMVTVSFSGSGSAQTLQISSNPNDFEICEDTEDTNACWVTGYKGDDANVVIPAYINNKKVVAVTMGTFQNNRKIVSLVLPDTITKSGRGLLFSNHDTIEYLSIPSYTTSFAIAANCPALKQVDIREGIAFAHYTATPFIRCENLRSLSIPKTLHFSDEILDELLSKNSTGSSEISVYINHNTGAFGEKFLNDARVQFAYSPDNYFSPSFPNEELSINSATIVSQNTVCQNRSCAQSIKLHYEFCPHCTYRQESRMLSIPSVYFGRGSLEILKGYSGTENNIKTCYNAFQTVKIAEGYKKITANSFANCGIKNLMLPSTIKIIEAGAFNNNQLQTLELPQNLTQIGDGSDDKRIKASVFSSTTLETAILRCDVAICENIFESCSNIRTIYVYNYNPSLKSQYNAAYFGLSDEVAEKVEIIFK